MLSREYGRDEFVDEIPSLEFQGQNAYRKNQIRFRLSRQHWATELNRTVPPIVYLHAGRHEGEDRP